MSFLSPTALVVTGLFRRSPADDGDGRHWAEVAREQAAAELARPGMTGLVSPLSRVPLSNAMSFAVFWHGADEGSDLELAWSDSVEQFRRWLREQAYPDGSSPLRWVVVRYADDGEESAILEDSAEEARAQQGLREFGTPAEALGRLYGGEF